MFTEIGIENFKAFGKMQRIPLKPITLLYGPNSSGKSSLIQTLLLFKQTLEESGDDKIVLLPKGNLIDLGGYQEFINGHDENKKFNISISFKHLWNIWGLDDSSFHYWYGKDNMSLIFSFYQDKTGDVYIASIKVLESLGSEPILEYKNVWEIPRLKRAVLKRKAVYERGNIDSADINRWLSDIKRSVLVLDTVNIKHDYFRWQWNEMIDSEDQDCPMYSQRQTEDEIIKLKKILSEKIQRINAELDKLENNPAELKNSEIEDKCMQLEWDKAKCRQLRQVLRLTKMIARSFSSASFDEFLKISDYPASGRLIWISNCFPEDDTGLEDAKKSMFHYIPDFASLGSLSKKDECIPFVYENLSPVDLLPCASSLLREYLRKIIYIGPLREYPERVYSYSGTIPSSVGKSGKYTQDILLKRPGLVTKVNDWFNRFNIGYELKVDVLKRNLFSLSLLDKKTGCEVSTKDVGFGVSQLLPIIVQGIVSQNNIICIEQPEIHIHPRLQAELGSFIAESIKIRSGNSEYLGKDPGNQFIIETHSENLILRLQKLIRKGELKKEDVAVIYCDKTQEGTVATELRLNDKGEFIDPWPQGFFEESFKEMFGE